MDKAPVDKSGCPHVVLALGMVMNMARNYISIVIIIMMLLAGGWLVLPASPAAAQASSYCARWTSTTSDPFEPYTVWTGEQLGGIASNHSYIYDDGAPTHVRISAPMYPIIDRAIAQNGVTGAEFPMLTTRLGSISVGVSAYGTLLGTATLAIAGFKDGQFVTSRQYQINTGIPPVLYLQDVRAIFAGEIVDTLVIDISSANSNVALQLREVCMAIPTEAPPVPSVTAYPSLTPSTTRTPTITLTPSSTRTPTNTFTPTPYTLTPTSSYTPGGPTITPESPTQTEGPLSSATIAQDNFDTPIPPDKRDRCGDFPLPPCGVDPFPVVTWPDINLPSPTALASRAAPTSAPSATAGTEIGSITPGAYGTAIADISSPIDSLTTATVVGLDGRAGDIERTASEIGTSIGGFLGFFRSIPAIMYGRSWVLFVFLFGVLIFMITVMALVTAYRVAVGLLIFIRGML